MSFFWEHESDRCRYPNFEVHTYPWPQYTILDSRFPPVMRSRKAGLPFATRARKRELSIQEVRIENDSDRKFSKSKFFKVFLKTTFLHDSCYPDHFEPKIFFRSSSKIFRVKIFSNKIKVFLETNFVHVSCYSDHYELKIFFRFSKSTFFQIK